MTEAAECSSLKKKKKKKRLLHRGIIVPSMAHTIKHIPNSIHFCTEGSLCLQWLTQSNTCHTPHSIPGKEMITSKLSSKELCRHDPSLQFTCDVHEENTIRHSVLYRGIVPLFSPLQQCGPCYGNVAKSQKKTAEAARCS